MIDILDILLPAPPFSLASAGAPQGGAITGGELRRQAAEYLALRDKREREDMAAIVAALDGLGLLD